MSLKIAKSLQPLKASLSVHSVLMQHRDFLFNGMEPTISRQNTFQVKVSYVLFIEEKSLGFSKTPMTLLINTNGTLAKIFLLEFIFN